MRRRVAAYCSAQGIEVDASPRFLTKSPVNSLRLPELTAAAPEAGFLYILRDPRDVLVIAAARRVSSRAMRYGAASAAAIASSGP